MFVKMESYEVIRSYHRITEFYGLRVEPATRRKSIQQFTGNRGIKKPKKEAKK